MVDGSWPKRRPDLEVIINLVAEGSRVLDLGCGNGELLADLVAQKKVTARGVEFDEENVRACIGRGLSVRHGDIDEGMADYPDNLFDYVILSQTISYLHNPLAVVQEMVRIGRNAIISFDNCGYWRERWRAAMGHGLGHKIASGEPLSRSISLRQFDEMLLRLHLRCGKRLCLTGARVVRHWPGLLAQMAVYVVTK